VDLSGSGLRLVAGSCEHSNVLSGSIKGVKYFDQPSILLSFSRSVLHEVN
jgi:hypothetical protein